MIETLGKRPETLEKQLSHERQSRLWAQTLMFTEAILPKLETTNDLVDFIRMVNLRAANAHGLGDTAWEGKLYSVKYKLLIRSAELRRNGETIKITSRRIPDRHGRNKQQVYFTFPTRPRPFVTETRFSNLGRLMPPEKIKALLEPFDL